jgi:urease accessory protein
VLEIFDNAKSVIGGCTKLPDENGLLIRVLGSFVDDLKNIIYSIVRIVRENVLNISFSGIRKI